MASEKVCTGCKAILPNCAFSKRTVSKDGLAFRCRSCRAVDRREYKAKNRDKIIAAQREYHAKNRDEICLKHRERRKKNLERERHKDRARYISTKHIKAAHAVVKQELIMGRMERGACEAHGPECANGHIEAHHDDYSRPLEVRWLCRSEHMRLHAAM